MESESAKSEASGSSHESVSPPRPFRGRGRPRRARGRGMRGRGRGTHVESHRDTSRSAGVEDRRRNTEVLISGLTEDQAKKLLRKVTEKVPSLVFDIMEERTEDPEPEPPTPNITFPPWCSCTRCQLMPSEQEQICCRKNKDNCVSLLPHFDLLCLDETVLAVARLQRQDLLALDQEPDHNKQMRHTAYRQFVYWQHGRLGEGRRRVIPSCCVWSIRTRFPDANNFYVGFKAGRFGV